MGTCMLGKSCERGEVPWSWEAPSLVGTWAGTERELQRLGGESGSHLAASRTERDQNKGTMPPSCTPQPETKSVSVLRADCGSDHELLIAKSD